MVRVGGGNGKSTDGAGAVSLFLTIDAEKQGFSGHPLDNYTQN